MTVVGLFGLLFSRCSAADGISGSRRAVASVAVFIAADVLLLGDTTSARVEVRDEAHRLVPASQVSWTSTDQTTAAVSIQGIVSAMGHGSTEISATVDGKTAQARVWVLDSTTSLVGPAVEPQLPRDSMDVAWRPPSGRTINVRRGDDLQRALETARRGDEVVIEAGTEFEGQFVLGAKPGDASDGWITVRTSALSALPTLGTRIDPAQHAALMPKLITKDARPALSTEAGASGWRLVGLEVTVDPNFRGIQQGIVLLGDGSAAQRIPQQVPRDLILDRVYVHGAPNVNLKRCVALNSAWTGIVDSQLLECHGKGFDSQAIGGWNGPGPYLIENNRLEAAGEIIMFGGSDPTIANLITSDVIIRRNYLFRPLSWKGVWTVKNLFELKNAQRLLLEGNVMENNWVDGQIGFAVLLGSVNQDGRCTWCVVQDVTLRYNHIHNSAGAFSIFERCGRATPGGAYGCDQGAEATRRVAIRHNLVTNIGVPGLGAGNGRMYQLLGKLDDLAIENNTGFAPIAYVTFGDEIGPMARFSFRNNVGGDAEYPVHASQAMGAQAVARYTGPGSRFERNVIITRLAARSLPPNNTYVVARTSLGLDDAGQGLASWRLSRESPYRASGSGASTPGADIDELIRRLAGVVLPGDAAAARRRP